MLVFSIVMLNFQGCVTSNKPQPSFKPQLDLDSSRKRSPIEAQDCSRSHCLEFLMHKYTTYATPMYWLIIAPYKSPPFGSCAIYFHNSVSEKKIPGFQRMKKIQPQKVGLRMRNLAELWSICSIFFRFFMLYASPTGPWDPEGFRKFLLRSSNVIVSPEDCNVPTMFPEHCIISKELFLASHFETPETFATHKGHIMSDGMSSLKHWMLYICVSTILSTWLYTRCLVHLPTNHFRVFLQRAGTWPWINIMHHLIPSKS